MKPKRAKKIECITENILDFMEERRRYKNEVKYKEVNTILQREIRKAKEKCVEIEMLDKIHDSFNMHTKILKK